MSRVVISGRPPKSNIEVNTIPKGAEPLGYEQLAVSTSAVGLNIPTNANMALIICEDATTRWRDDGTSPTASVGMTLWQNQSIQFNGEDSLNAVEFIRTASTDANLSISYYKY